MNKTHKNLRVVWQFNQVRNRCHYPSNVITAVNRHQRLLGEYILFILNVVIERSKNESSMVKPEEHKGTTESIEAKIEGLERTIEAPN